MFSLSDNFAEISNFNGYFDEINEVPSANITEDNTSINYHCNFCNENFKSESSLKEHACQAAGKKNLQCPNCQKTFNRPQGLKSHIRVCNPNHTFCEKCNKNFETRSQYRNHLHRHKEKIYQCEFCEKNFYNPNVYRAHLNIHTGKKSYFCHICNKNFNFQTNLNSHLLVHSETKQFKCETCSASYHHKWELKKHMNKHTKEKSYLCEYCGKLFYCSNQYRKHLHSHFDKGLVCPACNKKFKTFGSLRCHKRKYCKENPHIQKVCSTDPSSSRSRKKKTKKLIKPPSLLSLAMKAHLKNSDSKMYKCEICSASFISSILLGWHKNKYKHNSTKGQPRIRKKKTDYIDDLNKPETYSTNISSSQSQENKPETSQSSSVLNLAMNSHLNNPPNVKRYKCETCPASFTSSRLFESHKKHHEHNNSIDLATHWWTMWKPPASKEKRLKTDTLEIRRLQYAQFQQHCRNFENTSKYGCGLCEETFPSITDLNLHLPSHKDESFTLCMICEASFSFTYELIEHCFEILNDVHYLCKTCFEKFRNSDDLLKHLQEKHASACDDSKKSLFPENDCSNKLSTFCKETINNMASLNQHFTTYQGIHLKAIKISTVIQHQQFQCEHCSKTFSLASELVKHKSCCYDLCDETFDCKPAFLQQHVLHNKLPDISLDVKSIKCDLCHEIFIDNDKFNLHNCSGRSLSSESKNHFNCENILDDDVNQQDSCSKILNDGGNFNSMSNNSDHLVDTDSDNYTKELNLCNDSNRHLNSEPVLIEDEYSTIEKDPQCYDFDKLVPCQGSTLDTKFNDKKSDKISVKKLQFEQFQKHSKSYENNKFDCGLCKKSFCSNIDLSQHLLSHNDKNFTLCMICKVSFSFTRELIEHCLNILNNEHYLCKQCRKIYENKDELDKHLKTKHIHCCHKCDKSYSRKDSLMSHIRKKHCKKKQNLLMCVKCLKTFLLFSELKKHKSSICDVCHETFDCESALLQHKVLHNKPSDSPQEMPFQMSKNLSNFEKNQETSTNKKNSISNCFDSSVNLNNTSNYQEFLPVPKLGNSNKTLNPSYHRNGFDSAMKLISHTSSATKKNIQISSFKSIQYMDLDKISGINTNQKDFAKNLDASKNNNECNDSNPINSLKKLFASYDIHKINNINQHDSVSKSLNGFVNLNDKPDCVTSFSNLDKKNKDFNQSSLNSSKKLIVSHDIREVNKTQQDSFINSLDSSINLSNMPNFNEKLVAPDNSKLHQTINSCRRLESEPKLIENGCLSMEQNIKGYNSDKSYSTPDVSLDTEYKEKSEFLCVICDENYVNKWSFKQHMLAKHTVLSQPYTCEYCERKFSYISVYENHLASHKLN